MERDSDYQHPSIEDVLATPEQTRERLVEEYNSGTFIRTELLERTAKHEQLSPLKRFAVATSAFLRGIISSEQGINPNQQLKELIVSRQIDSEEDIALLTEEELYQLLDDYYSKKEEVIEECQLSSESLAGSDVVTNPTLFGVELGKLEPTRFRASLEERRAGRADASFVYQFELQRQAIDRMLSDESYQQVQTAKAEQKRLYEENERVKVIKKEHEVFVRAIRTHHPEIHARDRAYLTEKIQQKQYFEFILKSEEDSIIKVDSILEQTNISEDDRKLLERWLVLHQEFGLSEMSDEEYASFFGGGRYYVHSSSMFLETTRDKANFVNFKDSDLRSHPKLGLNGIIVPRFVEALKDGYMIGRRIAVQRGESMSHIAAEESMVSFDTQDNFTKFGTELGTSDHLAYSGGGSIPLTLIAPARLLEAHSVENAVQKSGEGAMFGSADSDPMSPKHEIPLALFTMLVPNVSIGQRELSAWFESFEHDARFTAAIESESWKGLKQGCLEETTKRVSVRELLTNIVSVLKVEGVSMPRLRFYELTSKDINFPTEESYLRAYLYHEARTALMSFINELNIVSLTPSPTTRAVGRFSEPKQNEIRPTMISGQLPEKYRLDSKMLDSTAAKIRQILR